MFSSESLPVVCFYARVNSLEKVKRLFLFVRCCRESSGSCSSFPHVTLICHTLYVYMCCRVVDRFHSWGMLKNTRLQWPPQICMKYTTNYIVLLYGMNVVSFPMANLIRAPSNNGVISSESIQGAGVAIPAEFFFFSRCIRREHRRE